MIRVLFDTNVILDVLENRPGLVAGSARSLDRAKRRQVEGVLCATTVTTLFYLVRKSQGRDRAIQALRTLLSFLLIAAVDRSVIELALDRPVSKDFEDCILHESGKAAAVDFIVTRNTEDFKGSSIPVLTPEQLETYLSTGP
jgi:predicted nucleic acid-binding protein